MVSSQFSGVTKKAEMQVAWIEKRAVVMRLCVLSFTAGN